MTLRYVTPIVVLLTFLISGWIPVPAQVKLTGIISGTVVNASTKQPLTSANVVVIGTTTGSSTDLDGNFSILNIPSGIYAVKASVVGFREVTITDVTVSPSRPAELLFELVQMEIALEEVTFTPGYFREVPDKPVSTTIQTSEEIRRLPGGFEDVVRAVSILPGVAQVSNGRNDLIVRGGAASENLYVVDNIEIPNINHFGTQGSTGGPQSYINLDFVDKTTFSTGGFGVRYGDKLSSVLTIDLLEGRSDRIGGKGTISATQFGLNLEGPLAEENGNFLFSARRSYLDFIFKAAGFSFVPEYWDFLGKASYDISPVDKLSFTGIVALDNVRQFNDDADQRYDNSRILATNQDNAVGGVTWRRLFNNGFFNLTFGQSYVGYNSEQRDSLLNPIFRNNSIEHEQNLRGDVSYALTDRTDFTFGLGAKAVRFTADVILDTLQSYFGDTLATNEYYNTNAWKTAGYFQVAHKFDYLRWTLGLRYDSFSLLQEQFVLSPRLSLQLPIDYKTNINASTGRYYQAPSYIWLVSDEQNSNLNYIGVNQYILGIEHFLREDTRWNTEFYYKDYYDYPVSETRPYLILANTGAGFGGLDEGFTSFGLDPLVSKGTGWVRGVEISLQKRYSEIPFYGLLAVSYNESGFYPLDGIKRPNANDQKWILNAGGGYLFNEKWEVAMKFRYATGRPYTPFKPDGTKSVDNYLTKRLEPNHSLDLRVDRRFYFSTWLLIAYVDVQNVYNFTYNSPPEWNFRENRPETSEGIGILPSIGLSVEF